MENNGKKLEAKDIDWYHVNDKKTKEVDTMKSGTHTVCVTILSAKNNWMSNKEVTVTVKGSLIYLVPEQINFNEIK